MIIDAIVNNQLFYDSGFSNRGFELPCTAPAHFQSAPQAEKSKKKAIKRY